MSKSNDKRTILQIIPAQNWYAVYQQDNDQPDEISPVVCWALVDDGKYRYVVGLDGGDYVDYCDEMSNFRGYQYKENKV